MDAMVIPVLALAIPIVIAPFAMAFKFARQAREMKHRERMRALELGRTLPGDESWSSPARIAVLIGAATPVGVFATAATASGSVGFHEDIWMSAMATSMTSVICGTVLAWKHFGQRARAEAEARAAYAKAADFDADAYDVVGARG
jgi:hypothetical protein